VSNAGESPKDCRSQPGGVLPRSLATVADPGRFFAVEVDSTNYPGRMRRGVGGFGMAQPDGLRTGTIRFARARRGRDPLTRPGGRRWARRRANGDLHGFWPFASPGASQWPSLAWQRSEPACRGANGLEGGSGLAVRSDLDGGPVEHSLDRHGCPSCTLTGGHVLLVQPSGDGAEGQPLGPPVLG
jgi:hypothetical protein